MSRKDDSCLACGGSTRIRPGEPRGTCPLCCPAEKEVLASCLELLCALRIRHWRNNTGGMWRGSRYIAFGVPGGPDIMGILPEPCLGRFLAVECKSGRKGRVEKRQDAWLSNAAEAGALTVVARSVDDLRDALRGAGIGG